MEIKRLTITVNIAIAVTVDAKMTSDGAVVVDVRDVELPSASEVMEAIDAGKQFAELDELFESA